MTQAPTLSLGRESLSSPRGNSTGANGRCLAYHRLPHQSRGCWELGVGGLPSSILTWVAPPPTAWQLGPQPHRTASPCLLGSALPPTRTAFPVHLSELLGCEADPVPSLLRLSPGPWGEAPSYPVTLLIQTNLSF